MSLTKGWGRIGGEDLSFEEALREEEQAKTTRLFTTAVDTVPKEGNWFHWLGSTKGGEDLTGRSWPVRKDLRDLEVDEENITYQWTGEMPEPITEKEVGRRISKEIRGVYGGATC